MAFDLNTFSFAQPNLSLRTINCQRTSIIAADTHSYDDDVEFSPLDTSALLPLSFDAAIGDLSERFGLYSLQVDASSCKSHTTNTFPASLYPLDSLAFTSEIPPSPAPSDASDTRSNSIAWSDISTSSTISLPPSTYHHASVRRRRQDALRQQCSASGLREISELVARMVEGGEQCAVCKSSESTLSVPRIEVQPASSDEPMDAEAELPYLATRPASSGGSVSRSWLSYRRSSDFSVSPASSRSCITKDVRWRKHTKRRRVAYQ